MAIVYGFAGLRDYGGELSFKPALPPHWQKLRFRLRVREAVLEVVLSPQEVSYRLLEGNRLSLRHRDELIVLAAGEERRIRDPDMAADAWTTQEKAVAASHAPMTRG
jgi:alpha,alpha-trehalose phosphorylase